MKSFAMKVLAVLAAASLSTCAYSGGKHGSPADAASTPPAKSAAGK